MAADSAGNDVTLVGVPLTGFLAYAPDNTDALTSSAGAAKPLTLPPGFKKVGLLKQDGGFEWTEEADGEPLEFWQDGYSIPTGLANVQLTFTAAEESAITRALRTGKVADENGYLTVDGGGVATRYLFFTEEIYRNGVIRRRQARGRVLTAKLQKNERGTDQGIEFTVEIASHVDFNNGHYGEWVIPATPIPATGATAGEPGAFTPSGATAPADLAALQGGSVVADPVTAWEEGEHVVLGDASKAYWTGSAWASGEAPA